MSASALNTLRVGIVPYLNMLPLVHGLKDLSRPEPDDPGLEIVRAPPSELTELMESGRIDLGMVPTGAVVDHPDWRIVGGTMIGSRGPVRSVLAFGVDPPERWTLVHPDSHSRTSNALLRILLAGRYGVRPEMGEPVALEDWSPPDHPRPGEAFLLIGTRALRWRSWWEDRGAVALDLGRSWTEWTGQTMVFAVWAARPGVRLGGWMNRFDALKNRNLARIDDILAQWPIEANEGMTLIEARDYLTRQIRFDFDPQARQGLERFYREGLELDIFQQGWDLRNVREGAAVNPAAG